MQPAIYVGLSAQLALEKRMETIARNVANMNTVAYRADEVKFESYMSAKGPDDVAFASPGQTFINRESGGLTRTDNLLDVAVEGEGWFAIQTPAGVVYTRDGRMQLTAEGQLQTLNGYPVLDVGGAPLEVDPQGGPPTIVRDGMIWQGNDQIGAVGLFSIPETAKLTRYENSGVIPNQPAVPILDFVKSGVRQGFTEGSNVDNVREMTKLIMVSRAFEAASQAISKGEAAQETAIKTLGETS